MCRIQEQVDIDDAGRRKHKETVFPCARGQGRALCSEVTRTVTESHVPYSINNSPSPTTSDSPGLSQYIQERGLPLRKIYEGPLTGAGSKEYLICPSLIYADGLA